jgi:hypothetical protein
MAYQSTTDSSRKFGSAFRGKRFDSYHGGDQPATESTPKEHSGDKVNEPNTGDVTKNVHAEDAHVETPSSVVEAHGPAHTIHISHNEDGTHRVSSAHEDGHTHETEHGSAKEAHDSAEQLSLEAGGDDQASNVKKRTHPDQQGAESEERGYEMPDLE